MKYLLSNLIIVALLFSCSNKKKDTYTLGRANGFRIDRYSQYSQNSWLTASGSAKYYFSSDEGGTLTINYDSYSDIYGNCTGSVVATLEESSADALAAQTTAENTGTYDVFSPYVVEETVNQSSSSIVINKIFKASVTSLTLAGCPFQDYTTNYYIVTLYKSGTLIITDWGRSKDYALVPIK